MAKYELHELCKMFPEADEQTLNEMAEDIKENGQNEPIILYEGKILDGRNRLLACEIAGVEPSFIQFSGEEPLQFVLSKNLYRRHLSDSQRAMMAHKVWEMTKGDKETKVKQSEILEQFQVSQPLLASAGRIKKIGADSVREGIEDGTMTISSADTLIKKARKRTSILDRVTDLSKEEIAELKKAQEDIIAEEQKIPRNLKAREFDEQILKGVYDEARYRKDVQEIQVVIAKLETLPILFDDAITMVGTLEQEKVLLAALDMLYSTIKKIHDKLVLHSVSYDDVLSIITDLLNDRFKLPEMEKTDERHFVENLKNQYILDCTNIKNDIIQLRKKVRGCVSRKAKEGTNARTD